ncbi:LLM class flavin-dependent oxidoreductase [Streptomyces sp. NPDC020298]|uniref:LLM class flavin-dependent oxidoreductase n=1 Tax=unclassified Streptomyces TaxID=2593676 RepID=UPI0033EC2672
MSSSHGRALLHLAAAVDLPSTDDAGSHVELARLAESGGLDFVTLDDTTLDDTFERPGPDALAVLSRVAPATHRIGLVPAVTATHADPSHVRTAVAALDRVSRGRAGWRLDAPAGEGEVAEAAARLWDGAPRSPQGHPVRVVDATEGPARPAAARHADVALVHAADPGQVAAVRDRLRASAAEAGRDPDGLRVLAGLIVDLGDGEHAAEPGHGGGGPRQTARGPLYRGGPVDLAELIAAWHADGVADGFHFTPAEPRRDLERLVNGTVALLQHRGLFRTFYPGSTLREHLGLARPARPVRSAPVWNG